MADEPKVKVLKVITIPKAAIEGNKLLKSAVAAYQEKTDAYNSAREEQMKAVEALRGVVSPLLEAKGSVTREDDWKVRSHPNDAEALQVQVLKRSTVKRSRIPTEVF